MNPFFSAGNAYCERKKALCLYEARIRQMKLVKNVK